MNINQGEVRQVGIEVISQIKQDFVIEAADYKITKQGIELESGVCTVNGNKILTLFSAKDKEPGAYHCEFEYRIGPEILKAKVYVEVKK